MKKTHTLKIEYDYYYKIKTWIKTFEIRKNDRNFNIYDVINFEIIPEKWNIYSWSISVVITDIFQEKWFWLEEWFCILSIKII